MSEVRYQGHCRRRTYQGFSLVELMISLVIGLVILGALVTLFSSTSRANREMATANSVIENGRFAIQLLENDVVHGGFWGTHVPVFDDQTSEEIPADVPTLVPDPCLTYNTANWDLEYVDALIGIPVQVYGDDVFADATTCDEASIFVEDDAQPNSDVLVVRHADTCEAGVGACEPDAIGNLYFQSSLCTTEDCATPPDVILPRPFVLDRTLADSTADEALFRFRQRDGEDRATKRLFVSNIYYVENRVIDGQTIPTLVRSAFDAGVPAHTPPEPLVEGVEAIRVELGVDNLSQTGADVDFSAQVAWADDTTRVVALNRGDGMPDGLFRLCSANPCYNTDPAQDALHAFTLTNVVAVRIHVLARSRDETRGYTDTKTYRLGNSTTVYGPYNDGFKRHVYTTTVRLPNIAGRRLRP